MKDRKKDEIKYLPVEKEEENSDQMPGRTDSWQYHYRGYQSSGQIESRQGQKGSCHDSGRLVNSTRTVKKLSVGRCD